VNPYLTSKTQEAAKNEKKAYLALEDGSVFKGKGFGSEGIKLEKNWMYSTKETAKVKKALEEYIKFGGFPEALKFGRIYLQTIYRDIVEKDVLFRYKIRDIQALRELAKYLISNFSKEITYGKLKNLINIKDVHTVKNYVEYLERAYLIFQVRRFSFKLKSQMLSPRKVYAVDTGLINAVSFKFSENIDRLMENLVFLELLRRRSYKFADYEIYYWKDAKGEVDFVVKSENKVTQLIQVTYELNKENFEREVAPLLKASKELKCKELLLITWDQEDTTKEGVKIMPLWKWLL